MNDPKSKAQTIIAFKADEGLAASLDQVVRSLDTDRSKFIRSAVRKEIANRRATGGKRQAAS